MIKYLVRKKILTVVVTRTVLEHLYIFFCLPEKIKECIIFSFLKINYPVIGLVGVSNCNLNFSIDLLSKCELSLIYHASLMAAIFVFWRRGHTA